MESVSSVLTHLFFFVYLYQHSVIVASSLKVTFCFDLQFEIWRKIGFNFYFRVSQIYISMGDNAVYFGFDRNQSAFL